MNQTKQISWPGPSRASAIIYWITTGLIGLETIVGAYWDLARISYVRDVFERLNYPLYFLTFIGIWKLVGAIVLLIHGWPRLKEWVYAGLVFTYTGAVFSHFSMGENGAAIAPLVLTIITMISWATRPPSRRNFTK
jgi:uncharacterized membrane protein YphA (DoxX/SURF4 family)